MRNGGVPMKRTTSNERLSRRVFLTRGAALGAATAAAGPLGSAEARTIHGEVPWAPGQADPPVPVQPGSYVYFTPEEAAFIESAVARLIPADDLVPERANWVVRCFSTASSPALMAGPSAGTWGALGAGLEDARLPVEDDAGPDVPGGNQGDRRSLPKQFR